MRVSRLPILAILLVAVTSPAAQAWQAPPPSTLKQAAPVPRQEPVMEEAVTGEVVTSETWFTIVAPDDSISFAMPAKPTVEAVQEADGTVSIVYECVTDRAVLQVLLAGLPDIAIKRREGLSPELYARLGFETMLVGVRSEAPDASATFLGSVVQNGMEGGDGDIVASTIPFPYHLRVLRAARDRMLIIAAIAKVSEGDREDIPRFMASVGRLPAGEARGTLKDGTREFVEVSRQGLVATTEEIPEPVWERVAPAGARFSVLMPPLIDSTTMAQLVDSTGKRIQGEQYMAVSKQVVLMLMVGPNTSKRPSPPRAALDSAFRGLAAGAQGFGVIGTPTFEREVTQNGVRGAQGRVTIGETGAYARIRIFETPTHLYMLSALVLYPQADDSQAITRFFDSFKFVR